MQRRYLALWFPFLSTDRLQPQRTRSASARPDERPLVVVEKVRGALRLADCDSRGVQLGLVRGLTLADARARIPDLTVVTADPQADQHFLAEIAEFCDRFTPMVALDPPQGLLLDITGCAHLFGGEAALRSHIGARLTRLGLTTRATIAGTPDAARALARYGNVAIAPPGQDEVMTRPLPVAALDVAAETVLALSRAGLKNLDALAERPSAALSARFGEELATRLRRTLGREDARITPLRPLPDCVVEQLFPEPFLDMAGLEPLLARLVRQAIRILEERGQGGRAFEASFFRTDGAVRRIMVETGRPSRDEAAILRLYHERLDTLADPIDPGFGFDAIRLAVPVCETLDVLQPSLDGRAVEEEAVADLVDRLVARFGRDRVLRFVAQDSHDPDRQARMVPASNRNASGQALAAASAVAWSQPEPDEPPARPLQIFDPPQPIETLAEVPDGPPLRFRWRRVTHDIARAEGPERIAPEWWRDGHDEPTRDYYRVEDAQGHRFWVFRRGLYGQGAEAPRWFLHGLFA